MWKARSGEGGRGFGVSNAQGSATKEGGRAGEASAELWNQTMGARREVPPGASAWKRCAVSQRLCIESTLSERQMTGSRNQLDLRFLSYAPRGPCSLTTNVALTSFFMFSSLIGLSSAASLGTFTTHTDTPLPLGTGKPPKPLGYSKVKHSAHATTSITQSKMLSVPAAAPHHVSQ